MPSDDPKIAILGWGSLIWDPRPEFDNQHGEWLPDGPTLKLEFSRISESRNDALTLVIDSTHGASCQVAYTMSTRNDPEDAIVELRCREGCIIKAIGFWFADGRRTCTVDMPATIVPWAQQNNLDVVVWTGLKSNFKKHKSLEFSLPAALNHLRTLPQDGKVKAAEYIRKAPNFVQTSLRNAVAAEAWFQELNPTA